MQQVVAGAVDVKDALLQVVVEQVDREERTDSVVPKVVLQVVTEILMEMSVEDQGMTLLEEAAVVGRLEEAEAQEGRPAEVDPGRPAAAAAVGQRSHPKAPNKGCNMPI